MPAMVVWRVFFNHSENQNEVKVMNATTPPTVA